MKALHFETLKQGDNENFPKKGAILSCHFTTSVNLFFNKSNKCYSFSKFINGDIIDSSREKNYPFEFQLGIGEVIQAWEIVLPKISLGQKILMTVTPEYAYGKAGLPGVIPPNSTIVFEIELLSIKY